MEKKHITNLIKPSMFFAMFVVVIIAIMGITPDSANAASIKLNKKALTLSTGDTYKLKLKGATGKVTWSSSNKKIATVSSTGKVTAKADGKVKIYAKYNKKKYTCTVTVNTKVVLDENAFTGLVWTKYKDFANKAGGYQLYDSCNNIYLGSNGDEATPNGWDQLMDSLKKNPGLINEIGKLTDDDFTYEKKAFPWNDFGGITRVDYNEIYTFNSDKLTVEIVFELREAYTSNELYLDSVTLKASYNGNTFEFRYDKEVYRPA